MSGTIPLSLSQQLDQYGKPLTGGKLYIIQAGTTATPQNPYQDSALTIPLANPIILDSAGRIPQFFLADGTIKIRLTDAAGVTQVAADGVLVIGPSTGTAVGSVIDPTTVLATGDLKVTYGTGAVTGFVRANGRTIGSASSGATERANSDCQALFEYLWGADANLSVSTGRGVSAAADWAANKTIALPDWRGRALAGLDDMGNSAAGRLTATYFGTAATALGAAGGAESQTLTLAQLPTGITAANAAQAISVDVNGAAGNNRVPFVTNANIQNQGTSLSAGSSNVPFDPTASWGQTGTFSASNAITVTSNNTSGNAHPNVGPMMLATVYLKL